MKQTKRRSTISPTRIRFSTGYERVLALVYLVFLLSIMAPIAFAEDTRPADFGKQWVRSHPFTIMALTQLHTSVEDNNLYSEAGMNTMLAWKNRPGLFKAAVRQDIPWQCNIYPRLAKLTEELKSHINTLVETYPGGQGFLVWDEPKRDEMDIIAETVAWIKQTHPGMLVYSNANPIRPDSESEQHPHHYGKPPRPESYTYEEHLNNFVNVIKTDVLMVDIYPFWVEGKVDNEWYMKRRYYKGLSMLRKVALQAGIPYWIFVQAYEHTNRCRFPSESDVRMQVYSSLAYGFTGIAYFVYDCDRTGFPRSILEPDNSPSPLYHNITRLNKEVANIGKALRFLTSTGVYYVSAKDANSVPAGTKAFRANPESMPIQYIKSTCKGVDKDVLLGCFKDDDGGEYFMVVNPSHGKAESAERMTVSVTLKFDKSLKKLGKLSRETGKPEEITVEDRTLKLELPGGTGDLFKIENSTFPGIMLSK